MRPAAAVVLAAAAAAGFAAAHPFATAQVRRVRRLTPVRIAPRRARPADETTASEASIPAAAAGAPTETRAEQPPWRGRDETASCVAGTGGAEARATVAWRVYYEPPTSARPSTAAEEREAREFARGVDETLAAEAPLGAPPWTDVAFQACGATNGRLAVAGRQFWPSASPEASADWCARTLGVRPDAARTVAAVDRLARFERERSALVRAAIRRLVEATRVRGDESRSAYFAESGRVYVFDAERYPDVDERAKSALAAEKNVASRAEEICR